MTIGQRARRKTAAATAATSTISATACAGGVPLSSHQTRASPSSPEEARATTGIVRGSSTSAIATIVAVPRGRGDPPSSQARKQMRMSGTK